MARVLRQSWAFGKSDSGAETRVVQQVLRHASIRNTEIYLRGEASGLREAMEGRRYHAAGFR
jgi:site-specific recombinase XerD